MNHKRNQITRGKNREVEDKAEIYSIIDESLICHIGFMRDNYPVVLPTNYCRFENKIILHGSCESPFHQSMLKADSVCISIALIDGLVLAKSAYSHSVNYRSVVIFGKASEVTEKEEKMLYLKCFLDHVLKGRWEKSRKPSESELNSTLILSIPIEEYSAKKRSGPPVVTEPDKNIDIWSGVLPLSLTAETPDPDNLSIAKEIPREIKNYRRKNK